METRHKRVLTTLGIAILILTSACIYKTLQLPKQITFSTTGQPTVGKGPIQIVLFEDLGCINCHHFTRHVVPKIASEYIDTGRARFTVVPVSFESNSIHLANAALAVYRIAPTQFIAYMIGLLDIEGSSRSSLLKVAQKVGGIDLEKLGYAIDRRIFFGEIERNLAWAMSIIPDFGTPMLYVNGYETPTDSFESLQRRIDQMGKKE
jgi:protein-disulfide isomerase